MSLSTSLTSAPSPSARAPRRTPTHAANNPDSADSTPRPPNASTSARPGWPARGRAAHQNAAPEPCSTPYSERRTVTYSSFRRFAPAARLHTRCPSPCQRPASSWPKSQPPPVRSPGRNAHTRHGHPAPPASQRFRSVAPSLVARYVPPAPANAPTMAAVALISDPRLLSQTVVSLGLGPDGANMLSHDSTWDKLRAIRRTCPEALACSRLGRLTAWHLAHPRMLVERREGDVRQQRRDDCSHAIANFEFERSIRRSRGRSLT
jgi:hypothetical protein